MSLSGSACLTCATALGAIFGTTSHPQPQQNKNNYASFRCRLEDQGAGQSRAYSSPGEGPGSRVTVSSIDQRHIPGTLWNLSSYEPLKMVIIDHGLQTLTHEVIVPHSGWEREPNEDSKPRDAEWTTVFKNTSGCLRCGRGRGEGRSCRVAFPLVQSLGFLEPHPKSPHFQWSSLLTPTDRILHP